MNIVLDNYTPLISYLSPASIPQIVAHIQDYLLKHPILSVETVAEIIVQSLQEHPELLNGEAIPISADSEQSIKAYIDALPFLDTYTKAEINALLLGKQDTLTFDQAPTPGSSNPVTSSGIIAALSALQSALETQIGLKADSASTYTKTQVDTLLEDKADADNVYSKNTIDAKFLEVNTELDNVNDALDDQSQQIATKADIPVIVTVTVDANGATMSAEDQAKLTADMVMCWYTGDRTKLTSNLSITPAAGTATVTGTASSSTTFTVAFIHSDNGGGIASVISPESIVIDVTPERLGGTYTANITFNYFKCIKNGRFVTLYGQFIPSETFTPTTNYVRYRMPFVANAPSSGLMYVINNGKIGGLIINAGNNVETVQFGGTLSDSTYIQANQIVNFSISYIS